MLGIASAADLWSTTVGDSSLSVGSTFYVATDGSDGWSGKLAEPNSGKTDGPFATLVRARDAVRELKGKQAPPEAIIVTVRGGKYYLGETLTFGAEDSGSSDFPIRYESYPGEKVILSGGKQVSGWKPFKGQILHTVLPGSKGGEWKFQQLFLNGERQTRSRYPKYDAENPLYGGWAFLERPAEKGSMSSFIYKPGTFSHHWVKPRNGVVVLMAGGGWVDAILPVKAVDEETRKITMGHGFRNPDVAPYYAPDAIHPGDRFRLENLLEELTEPGEWCLDSEEGILYFWPPNGPLKPTDEVVTPAVDTLVDINGASWLVISGITFTETGDGDDFQRPGLDGYGPMYPTQGWKYCGEAVHLKGAEHCIIENNRFHAVGGNGIYLERYNSRNVVRRNEISHAGANGICLLGNHVPLGSVSEPMPGTREPLPMFNEVTDNHIHHCGILNKYVAGVFLGVSDSNLIAHNKMEHLPHHAINLGINGYGRNLIEYNEIHHVCEELRDNGAINAWMDDSQSDERAGHIIRFNLMTDVEGCATDAIGHILAPDGMANGIYLDNNTSNCVIHGNIIVRASGYGIFVHGGGHNLIANNIIVDSTTTATHRPVFGCAQVAYAGYLQGSLLFGNHFCNNIVCYGKPQLDDPMALFVLNPGAAAPSGDNNDVVPKITDVLSECEANVFFQHDKEKYIITETGQKKGELEFAIHKAFSFAEWQRLGFDAGSQLTDPLFVDPFHDDYRLKPESPAIRLGFVPIQVEMIGIRAQC